MLPIAIKRSLDKVYRFSKQRGFRLGLNVRYAGDPATIKALVRRKLVTIRAKRGVRYTSYYLFPTSKGKKLCETTPFPADRRNWWQAGPKLRLSAQQRKQARKHFIPDDVAAFLFGKHGRPIRHFNLTYHSEADHRKKIAYYRRLAKRAARHG
jgi:hypothetical protein